MHLRYGPVMLREGHGERSSRTREQSSVSQMPTLAFICMTDGHSENQEIRLKHPHERERRRIPSGRVLDYRVSLRVSVYSE